MNNNRRRNFRSRPQKNNFRRRNGSMNNLHNVEKAMQKFLQLAKDAQSNGDPVLAQNYLQHADHYLRRFNELNDRRENSVESVMQEENSLQNKKEDSVEKENQATTN